MTATTAPPASGTDSRTEDPQPPDTGRRTLAGTVTLARFMLRRDRVKLPAWAGGLGLFIAYVATAVPSVLETQQDLRDATTLYGDPVGRMLIGPGYGFDAPTYERFMANGYGLYLLVLAALMSLLLVVRHTRGEEQTGRAELVRANVVGRHAALSATLMVAAITNLVVAGTVFLAMVVVGGYGATGSSLLAAAVAAVGLAFAGVAALTVQLTEYSRAAAGMAGAGLGTAFVLRAGGDMAREGGNVLSWLSPLGWGQQSAPFVLNRWWPLALPLAFAVVTAATGYALSTRRDFGASLFAVRPGPPRAAPSLGTPLGLALRLQRAGITSWTVALGIAGLAFGAYADPLEEAAGDLPEAFLDLFGAEDILAGYLAYMATFMAFLVAAYVILAVQGLRTEETGGRAEPVLATPISRWGWLCSNLVVIAAGVVALMAIVGLATGVGVAIAIGDGSRLWGLTMAHLNLVPAVLVILGVAGLLFGVLPATIPAVWALVGYGLVVGTFGPMLDLPQMAYNLSLFEHAAEMPLESFALTPVLIVTLLAIVPAILGPLAFRRRDIEVT